MPIFAPMPENLRGTGGDPMALVTRFVAAAQIVTTLAGLAMLLDEAARDLGFRYHALVEHADLSRRPPNLLFLHNYPENWVKTFAYAGLHRQDPAQKLASRRPGAFLWDDLHNLTRLTRAQERLLDQAHHAGLGAGFTVPLQAAGQRSASCSFATEPGHPLPEHMLLAAELLAHLAFATAFNIRQLRTDHAGPHLTPREAECVALMAQGKTDWEIGIILGLSEETVTKYLKAARRRFGVTRRAQLVVAVLAQGQLSLGELAPWQ